MATCTGCGRTDVKNLGAHKYWCNKRPKVVIKEETAQPTMHQVEIPKLTSKYSKSYLTQFIMNCEHAIAWARKVIDTIDAQEKADFEEELARKVK